MTATSRTARLLATTTALALHGLALWGVSGTTKVEMEGSSGATRASLGNSFADMTAGTLSPTEADTPTEPTPPTETTRAQPAPAQQADRPENVTAPKAPNHVTPTVAVEQDIQTQPLDPQQRIAPQQVTQAEPTPPPQPAQPANIEPLAATDLAETAETLKAAPEPPTAVTTSLRPQSRPETIEKAQTRQEQPRDRQQAARHQPKGNAAQNARTGADTGTETARNQANTGTGQSRQSGNAAASNYPGLVMRKISRVRRPQVGSRGTAVVAFTISPGGGLSGLSLARSSGNGRLDQAALGVIRRAAPFPAPPPGARRSFSINIKGG